MLNAIWNKILNEPVMVLNFINALFALFVAFGLDITVEQKTGIIGVVTVLVNLFARAKVTPTRKLNG
jgi:hypothetical protein